MFYRVSINYFESDYISLELERYLSILVYSSSSQSYFCYHSLTFPWWKVSKNQGSFQGIFYFILFRKNVRKYFPSRFFSRKKRNAITEKFTTNSVERPFQLHFEMNLISDSFFRYFIIVSPTFIIDPLFFNLLKFEKWEKK